MLRKMQQLFETYRKTEDRKTRSNAFKARGIQEVNYKKYILLMSLMPHNVKLLTHAA